MNRKWWARCATIGMFSCLSLTASPILAVTTFNDGAVHNVSAPIDQIEILDGAGSVPTTVNVLTGAVVGAGQTAFSVNVRDTSVFNMSGGSLFDELFLFNSSSAHLTGGSIGDDLTPDNNASVLVTSVTVNDDVEAHGGSTMTINGGSFDEDVESLDNAVITINGGTFQTGADAASVSASGSSTINIHAGVFGSGSTTGSGGFNATDTAVINIFGGDIAKQTAGLNASANGVINVYGLGSQPASINTVGGGVINFREGSLQSLVAHGPGVKLSGTDGSLSSIIAEDSSVIRIFGTGFKGFNGAVDLPYGPIPFAAGNLTGTLADGTPITSVSFSRNLLAGGTRGVIILVPEPGSIALALLPLLGAVAYRGRRS
ncbi:MAG: hypothetical protein AB7G28_00500 [Pirellulales bacterium]